MRTEISYIETDFLVEEFDHQTWKQGVEVLIDKYWSGENAPDGRNFRAKLLWSDSAFYVRFEANQKEPLMISESPNPASKTKCLWEKDVCEIFIAPDKNNPRKYFEFEIAPTGEWIDLKVHQLPDQRETDWNYHSQMQSAARIEKNKIWMAMKIPWTAFGSTPKTGDVWLGNILRCVGNGETRGYLAWSPTLTKEASFHVPEKFGEFEFVK